MDKYVYARTQIKVHAFGEFWYYFNKTNLFYFITMMVMPLRFLRWFGIKT